MTTVKPLVAMDGFTFGCDPEMFVFDPEGRPVAADMIPGSKEEPHKVKFGAVQRDGMAAEFNIDPAKDFAEFNRNISAVMQQLAGFLPEGHTLKAVPAVRFDPEIFNQATDEAKVLGCSPDFNAWTGELYPPPNDPEDPYMRCAGGHLHFGWTTGASLGDDEHVAHCRDLVKQLDWYLGAWSVRMDPDPTRRRLYGKAGACRFKDYGVEYRVLSNFWITTRARRLNVWNRMVTAIDDMRRRFLPGMYGGDHNNDLIQIINETSRSSRFEGLFPYPVVSVML